MKAIDQNQINNNMAFRSDDDDDDDGKVVWQHGLAAPEFKMHFESVEGDDRDDAMWYPQFNLALPYNPTENGPPLPQTFQNLFDQMSSAFSHSVSSASATAQATAVSVIPPTPQFSLPTPPQVAMPADTGDALDRALAALKAEGGDRDDYRDVVEEVYEAIDDGVTRDSLANTITTFLDIGGQKHVGIDDIQDELEEMIDDMASGVEDALDNHVANDKVVAAISNFLTESTQNLTGLDRMSDQIEDILDNMA